MFLPSYQNFLSFSSDFAHNHTQSMPHNAARRVDFFARTIYNEANYVRNFSSDIVITIRSCQSRTRIEIGFFHSLSFRSLHLRCILASRKR